MNELTNVTTGEVRLSYVHLFKPYAAMQGAEERYSCTILVPKTDTDTMGRIQAAIEEAKRKGTADTWGGVCPPLVPTPVYDGDGVRPSDGMAFGPECKGHWVFTANAKADYPPEIVDKMGNPIINQSEIYRSCVTENPWEEVLRPRHRPSGSRSRRHPYRMQIRYRGDPRAAGSIPSQGCLIKRTVWGYPPY